MPPKDNGKGKAAAAPPPYQRVILRGAGQLTAAQVEEFHRFMQANNNTFHGVTFDQGTVTESMHESTSLGDPSNLPRIGITLTNDTLMRNDGTTHLLHFRPDAPQYHFVYRQGYTRAQVTDMQNKRKARRDAKKNKTGGGAGGQGGGRGGGASGAGGAGRGSTAAGAGRGGSTQTQQQAGRGSATTGAGRGSATTGTGRGAATTGAGRGTTAGKAPPAPLKKK